MSEGDNLEYAMVSGPRNKPRGSIKSVGIRADTGSSVLRNCEADLLFTGERSDHDALEATTLDFVCGLARRGLMLLVTPALGRPVVSESGSGAGLSGA